MIDEYGELTNKGIAAVTPIVLFIIWLVGELSI